MLEVLKFVFSSFWVWLGTLILLAVVLQGTVAGLAVVIAAIRGKK